MISCRDENSADLLELLGVEECRLLVVHEPFLIPLAEHRFDFRKHTRCLSSAFLGTALAPILNPDLRIETLGIEWTNWLVDHYAMDGQEYLSSRLEAGEVWGGFRGEQIAAFIGLHEEGSMGMLVVLDEFRRQGIAEFMVTDLATRLLAKGLVPHDHIIVGNDASEALQRKLGFEISTRTICWMSAGDRGPGSGSSDNP